MLSLLLAKQKGKLRVWHVPAIPGTKGWLRGGQGVTEGWPRGIRGVAIPLQVPRVLQNTPYLLGSALIPFARSFTTPVQPAKLTVQGITCCLLLSQKFTSSIFISRRQIPAVKRGFHAFIWNPNLY